MKYSAIDQLLIFILFVIGSIISSIIQNKKKAEEQRKAGGLPPPNPTPSRPRRAGEMPVPPWPSTAKSWQEEVRRILEGQRAPQGVPPKVPAKSRPIPPPVTGRTSMPPELSEGELAFDSPLRQSNSAYKLAAQLDEKVAARLQQIEKQTETARPAPFVRAGSAGPQPTTVRALLASPVAVRNAFVASLIFGPPAALDSQDRF